MPRIYLSPSTQESNPYIIGGSEEYYMNLVADAMEPYLRSSGIQFSRNTPQMTAASSIRAGNAGNYDFYLALHSNAAPDVLSGQLRGTIAFYDPRSSNGRRMANIIVENLKSIYPLPERVRAESTTSLGEVTRTRMPAVLVEIAYHDNYADATWISQNIDAIASQLVLSLTEYFGIPFVTPQTPRTGYVAVSSGSLNIRDRPSLDSTVIAQAPNGARLTVVGQTGAWYVVEYGSVVGYAASQFVRF